MKLAQFEVGSEPPRYCDANGRFQLFTPETGQSTSGPATAVGRRLNERQLLIS